MADPDASRSDVGDLVAGNLDVRAADVHFNGVVSDMLNAAAGEAAPLGVLGGVVQVWELGGAPLVSSFICHGLRLSMGFEPLPTTEGG